MAESIQVMARDAIFLDVDYRYSYPQRDIEERRITEGYYKSSGTSNDRFDGIYANTYIPFHGIQDGGLIIKSSTLKKNNELNRKQMPWKNELITLLLESIGYTGTIEKIKKEYEFNEFTDLKSKLQRIQFICYIFIRFLESYIITKEHLYLSIYLTIHHNEVGEESFINKLYNINPTGIPNSLVLIQEFLMKNEENKPLSYEDGLHLLMKTDNETIESIIYPKGAEYSDETDEKDEKIRTLHGLVQDNQQKYLEMIRENGVDIPVKGNQFNMALAAARRAERMLKLSKIGMEGTPTNTFYIKKEAEGQEAEGQEAEGRKAEGGKLISKYKSRKSRKSKKSRKSRKPRKSRKSRKSRKPRKSRKH